MTAVTEDQPGRVGAPDHQAGEPVPLEVRQVLRASCYRPDCTNEEWRVVLRVREHVIGRYIWYDCAPWSPAASLVSDDIGEVIWPAWPASLAEAIAVAETPLQGLQQRWDATINRLRDSAKWMAAVLGAALASVIPAAPLAHLTSYHFSAVPATLGVTGLFLLNVTLVLVLQVMRPQTISYADVQYAAEPTGLRGALHKAVCSFWPRDHAFESALYRWKHTILRHPDLYLPCGVYTLFDLRRLMIVEEVTLMALSKAREICASDELRRAVGDAQNARAARLHELRAAAAMVVTVGMYHNVRARSIVATLAGSTLGFLGIIAIIAAVAWPAP